MKPLSWILFCLLGFVGCADHDLIVVPPDGSHSTDDGGSCPISRDMASFCNAPAASGLTGKSLVCIDFANTKITDNSVAAWNFSVNSMCPWTISSGILQLVNYSAAG